MGASRCVCIYSITNLLVNSNLCLDFLPNPREWPGEYGAAVKVPELNDTQMYNEKFKIHQFNILASDRIALNRSLKDNRFDEYENHDFIINN